MNPATRRGRDREMARYRRVLMERDRAAELTELLARTWPPRAVMELDGWRLRNAPGLPAHAASAWPRSAGERVPLRVRLDGVQRYYAQSGLTPAVLISPAARPAGTEAALSERGWSKRHAAEIRTGALEALAGLAAPADVRVALDQRPTDDWLAAWAALTGRDRRQRDVAAASLARCDTPGAFVRAWTGERLAGAARAVADGGWVGVPDMAVEGDAQVATALARAVADWAGAAGAEEVWWLVADPAAGGAAVHDLAGAAAVEVTRRAQLSPALRLHVRVAPDGAAGSTPAATS